MSSDENDLEEDSTDSFNLYAVFVLDASIPNATINKVFQDAFGFTRFDGLWLAEDYDSIDVHCGDRPGSLSRNHRCTAIGEDWVSPWAGKDLHDAAEFVRNTPKPPKALDKEYFVVLDKEQYEARRLLTVCKIVDGEVQSLACGHSAVTIFLEGHNRDAWSDYLDDWQDDGVAAG